MADLPHMAWLRAFEAAARHSSFTAAARELGLTPAAVSQQIRLLEQHLDVTLFERLARGVTLTDIGQAYALSIRRAFTDIEAATHSLFEAKPPRTVRVRATISFAALVLAPQLPVFCEAHPGIHVELTTAVWADRFSEDSLDVDIRYGYGDWPETNIQHLGDDHAVVVCPPNFQQRHGDACTVSDIANSNVVKIVGSDSDWAKLSELFDLRLADPAAWIKVDSSLIALQAVMSGLGSTIVLESYARPYIDRHLVVAPFDFRLPIQRSHYLVVREGAERREDVQLFCDWIIERYGEGQ